MSTNRKPETEESAEQNATNEETSTGGNPAEMTHEELVAYYEQEYIRESLASRAPKNPEAAAESPDFPAWAGVAAHVIVFVIAGLVAFFWLGSIGVGTVAAIILAVIIATVVMFVARMFATVDWSISGF